MNSTWKSLLWKEWREQRWRLVALTLLAISFVLTILAFHSYIGVRARSSAEIYLLLSTLASFSYAILAGTFTGMSAAGGENSYHTMRFLKALPTSMKEPALAKLFVSMLSVLIPLMLMFVCLYLFMIYSWGEVSSINLDLLRSEKGLVSLDQGINYWYLTHAIATSIAVVSVLLWMMAGGVNRSDEVSAGAVGFLVCVGAWMMYALLLAWAVRYSPFLLNGLVYLVPALPGGPAIAFLKMKSNSPELSQSLFAFIAALTHGAVLVWYLNQFGRVAVPPKRAGGIEFDFLNRIYLKNGPMKSQWRAIAWKQLRETGPLAAVAVAGVLVVVLIVHFINSQNSLNSELGEILGGTSLSVGFFVILVAGVGLFLEDFAPRVNNFWRSRPLNINLWFVVKYLTGLSVLVLAFGSLLLLAYWLQTGISFEFDQEFILATFFGAYSVIILFTLAMTSYCLLRQPLYAVVVTLAFFLCGMMTIDWLFPDPSYIGIGIAAMILVLALLSRIAYLAVKHDWGWKAGR